MPNRFRILSCAALATVSILLIVAGWWMTQWLVAGVGAGLLLASLVLAKLLLGRRHRKEVRNSSQSTKTTATRPRAPAEPLAKRQAAHPGDLAEEMIAANRYALLLRPQIAGNLNRGQVEDAREALEEDMAIVPEGDVFLCQPDDRDEHERPTKSTVGGRVLRVEAALIDRYPVTNFQFKQFIDAGGYEEMALWDSEIWPGVFGFVDATGQPGPRFWNNGQYAAGEDDHPVVGISWFEANAYSRWVGKRLPTDAEWVKTGCWPMPVQRGVPTQRRFPWGNTWEPDKANVWSAGIEATCSVTEFPDGASVAGVYGLVGNVWEWTADPFGLWHGANSYQGTENFRSLRGGAFDTYFESQANCQFQSGDSPLARKRNIGFRCAIGLCDLHPGAADDAVPAGDELVCEGV